MKDEPHKRNAFRIDDELIIKHRVATLEDVKNINLTVEQVVDSKLEIRHLFNTLDLQISSIKVNLEFKYGELSKYLQTLEKKINILAAVISKDNGEPQEEPQTVNLSETGLAFETNTQYKDNSFIKMEITLQPQYHIIPIIAQVTKVIEKNNTNIIATQFVHIRAADQQALARHIMRKQTEILKQQ